LQATDTEIRTALPVCSEVAVVANGTDVATGCPKLAFSVAHSKDYQQLFWGYQKITSANLSLLVATTCPPQGGCLLLMVAKNRKATQHARTYNVPYMPIKLAFAARLPQPLCLPT